MSSRSSQLGKQSRCYKSSEAGPKRKTLVSFLFKKHYSSNTRYANDLIDITCPSNDVRPNALDTGTLPEHQRSDDPLSHIALSQFNALGTEDLIDAWYGSQIDNFDWMDLPDFS